MKLAVVECEDTTGEWGKPCPSCGQVLPARTKTFPSWRSKRRDESHVHPPEPKHWMRRKAVYP